MVAKQIFKEILPIDSGVKDSRCSAQQFCVTLADVADCRKTGRYLYGYQLVVLLYNNTTCTIVNICYNFGVVEKRNLQEKIKLFSIFDYLTELFRYIYRTEVTLKFVNRLYFIINIYGTIGNIIYSIDKNKL